MAMKKKTKVKTTKSDGARTRKDGWSNVMTGLRRQNVDKGAHSDIVYEPLEAEDAEELYAADDIAAKIVDELPHEAFREGWEITHKGGDEALGKKILDHCRLLDLDAKLELAWSWARLYGGSGVLILTTDMDRMNKPLSPASVEITGFTVLSKEELQARNLDYDLSSPNYGLPRAYNVTPRGMGMSGSGSYMEVHYSRIIRFDGAPLPRRLFVERRYWGDSVLSRAKSCIQNFSVSHEAAATVLNDFSVAVYGVKGLMDAISQGDDQLVLKRMQTLNLTRSIARAAVIDADGETFTYQQRQVSGMKDLLDAAGKRVVAAADRIPHTRLLGESPDGSQATGNSTTLQWYDYVGTRQEQYLKPRLMAVLNLICISRKGPTNGKIPDGMDVVFKPLWQLDDKEAATVRQTQSLTDQAYIEDGVLDPEEVRESRFGTGKYSYETRLNKGADPLAAKQQREIDAQKALQQSAQKPPKGTQK